MVNSRSKREEAKLKELVREYSQRGYRVVSEPAGSDLPGFLRPHDWRPDIIAYSEQENLVIEVRSRKTMADAKRFARIADVIRAQEGWDFVLVVTNPKDVGGREIASASPSMAAPHRLLDQAEHLLGAGGDWEFAEAALLVAWAGFEAVLRLSLARLYGREKPLPPLSLLRDSIMYGVVSKEDSQAVEHAAEVRNALAHGYQPLPVEPQLARRLVELGRTILAETEREASSRETWD